MITTAATATSDLAHSRWTVVVVGAGPAGTVAAGSLARRGADVLLIDRRRFPRDKACGCCLGPVGVRVLRELGWHDVVDADDAGWHDTVRLWRGQADAVEVAIPPVLVRTRLALDVDLIDACVAEGVVFHDEVGLRGMVRAAAGWRLTLAGDGREIEVHADAVVLATGLARIPLMKSARREGPIGLATRLSTRPAWCGTQGVTMVPGPTGYVGVVSNGTEGVVVAAAIDHVRPGERAAAVVEDTLARHGLDLPGARDARWYGAPPFRVRGRRSMPPGVFVIGDASGFAEPLTGEGMSWAMRAGRAVTPFVLSSDAGSARAWPRAWQETIGRRQRQCRMVTRAFRNDWVRRLAMPVAAVAPRLAASVVRRMVTT